MKHSLALLCSTILSCAVFAQQQAPVTLVKDNFQYAETQLKAMLAQTDPVKKAFPRSVNKEGKLTTTNMYDWTSGFFPGSLWYTYEFTKDTSLKSAATAWTEVLEPLQYFTKHHDLGFMVYCSYGNAYRLTGNEAYKKILIQTARSLSTRFNPVAGVIKSWEGFKSWHGDSTYRYPVIIDNMMNLELLFFASKATGDTSFRHIAVTHALHTMQNHIRKDFGTYHVVCYDTITGKVVAREAAQGYADNSIWARGQAWAIYGFTMTYRETKDPRFLQTAQKAADRFLNDKNLPADKVPLWDFNARQPGFAPGKNSRADATTAIPRDASAAAITASALLELSTFSNKKKAAIYKAAAIQMLTALSTEAYRTPLQNRGNFLLTHSVGSIPHRSEIDVPLVYADYYYIEATLRYHHLLNGKAITTPGMAY